MSKFEYVERERPRISSQKVRCCFIFFHPQTKQKLCERTSEKTGAVHVFVHEVCSEHNLKQVLVTCFDTKKNNTHAVYKYKPMK